MSPLRRLAVRFRHHAPKAARLTDRRRRVTLNLADLETRAGPNNGMAGVAAGVFGVYVGDPMAVVFGENALVIGTRRLPKPMPPNWSAAASAWTRD